MLKLETRVEVDGLTGSEVFAVLAEPRDDAYRAWWPGVHLHLHPVGRQTRRVGQVVIMDEYVGGRRVRMAGIVREAVPGRRLVWQLKKLVPLPVRLALELSDTELGVLITHRVSAGFRGLGALLDPLWRLVFTPAFAAALDDHVHTEFKLLRDRRSAIATAGRARPDLPPSTR